MYVRGGRQPTGLDAIAWASECVARGAGEILLTSIDCDGSRAGYDLELTRAVAERVGVPIIASGGAGSAEHLLDALCKGGADAALIAGIVHDREMTVQDIKHFLIAHDLPVRPHVEY